MELGERIKQARLEAGLSQRQLCGDRLTRNMLSLIENGAARPSMDTLRYFAQALGKPVGWFLEEQTVSPNHGAMQEARRCWQAADGKGALEALEAYEGPDEVFDPERGLLRYLALLSEAEQALAEGRAPFALHLLEQAAQEQSPYITKELGQRLFLLLAQAGAPASLNCDEVLLAQAQQVLEKDPARCVTLLQAAQEKNAAHWQYLAGQARFALGQYAAAAEHLRSVETVYPKAVSMLEVCYRELGDFKKAYEYACKGR